MMMPLSPLQQQNQAEAGGRARNGTYGLNFNDFDDPASICLEDLKVLLPGDTPR